MIRLSAIDVAISIDRLGSFGYSGISSVCYGLSNSRDKVSYHAFFGKQNVIGDTVRDQPPSPIQRIRFITDGGLLK